MSKLKPSKLKKPHVAAGHNGKKAEPTQVEKDSISLVAHRKKPKTKPKVSSLSATDPERVKGVPDVSQIEKAIGQLEPQDRETFQRVRELLAQQLGSDAAARLWLVTHSPPFVTTPLDEIRKGNAVPLLALLESQGSMSPSYA